METATLPTATRRELWDHAARQTFDVMIVGGGVTGACLYHVLCAQGQKVLLVDQGDFACGTSQSSGMMIWGGLLYLRHLHLRSVLAFSRCRNELLSAHADLAAPAVVRYVPSDPPVINPYLGYPAALFYWLLGMAQGRPPEPAGLDGEQAFLRIEPRRGGVRFEEGQLRDSDARFVLHWITPHQSPEQIPLNYCRLESGAYTAAGRKWFLHLRDQLTGKQTLVSARHVVNCSGVWTDQVNDAFGIRSRYRHALSKGVYLNIDRPQAHRDLIVCDQQHGNDVLTLVPWGPVSLWGPTETWVDSIADGYRIAPQEVEFLLESSAARFRAPLTRADIVSVRCGVRPLVVNAKRDASGRAPFELSRGHRIERDADRQWISVYGGKLTSCLSIAREVRRVLPGATPPRRARRKPQPAAVPASWDSFPGLEEKVPSIEWCARHEFCHTIDDYLRRRTNIAQWVRREGLGRNGENAAHIAALCRRLYPDDEARARAASGGHETAVGDRFDRVVAAQF